MEIPKCIPIRIINFALFVRMYSKPVILHEYGIGYARNSCQRGRQDRKGATKEDVLISN